MKSKIQEMQEYENKQSQLIEKVTKELERYKAQNTILGNEKNIIQNLNHLGAHILKQMNASNMWYDQLKSNEITVEFFFVFFLGISYSDLF